MSSEPRASGTLPAPLYLLSVALVTGLAIATAMALRPVFAHKVLEMTGLETQPQAAPGSFYTARIAPLFAQHCTSCHGETRQKAELRLDNYAFALRGGRHGAVIRPGDPRASELMTRIALPAGDDKAMPPEGKTPLSPDDVTVIRLWIATGASPTTRIIKGAPQPVADVKIPELDPVAARHQRAPLAAAMQQLSVRYPGIIVYQSRNSADLELNAALRGASFTDADLKAFLPVRGHIVLMDLSGTAITDASAQTLARMTALQTLRLTNTKTGDATISALTPLRSLKSVSVSGTHATKAVLTALSKSVMIHGDDNAD